MTPEQLREDGHFGTREEMIARYKELKAAHAAALEELARVKQQREEGERQLQGWVTRAGEAEAALAEAERKCERLKFHAKAMVGAIKTYEVREGLNHGGTRRLIECIIADYLSEFKE